MSIKMKDWDKITADELGNLWRTMCDSQIAELFHVTVDKVRYKRQKHGITLKNRIYDDFVNENPELFQKLNSSSKERLLESDLNVLAKALTHYVFRNGPVEDMHANGQLSQSDMKILNKFMANKFAGLLYKMMNNDWLQIELLLEHLKLYGTDWDEVVPDTKDFEILWKFQKEEVKDKFFESSSSR